MNTTDQWLKHQLEAYPELQEKLDGATNALMEGIGDSHPLDIAEEWAGRVAAAESRASTLESDLLKAREALKLARSIISATPEDTGPCLSDAEQKAQGARCGCFGADDYCGCQNVPDATTRRERAAGERHD